MKHLGRSEWLKNEFQRLFDLRATGQFAMASVYIYHVLCVPLW